MADAAKKGEELPPPEIDRALRDEIRRRAAELDAGRARLVEGDEVFAGLRQLITDHQG